MRISRVPLCHVARGGVRAADNLFELGKAPRSGGDQSAIRLVSQRDAAWAGVPFVAAAARA
ncbi:hypothetical protein [Streptomyces sp. NPDC050759]|uniref:hypothetical protein n=1 Tax=Streptomyces sp. NPDC050759 TaxID=3365635 RepID=UPI0037957FE8